MVKALEQNHKNVRYWHFQNIIDFIRNVHALEKIKIKNFFSTNTIKNYVDGIELIFLQVKKIIDKHREI
jgi:hypothetical protein